MRVRDPPCNGYALSGRSLTCMPRPLLRQAVSVVRTDADEHATMKLVDVDANAVVQQAGAGVQTLSLRV